MSVICFQNESCIDRKDGEFRRYDACGEDLSKILCVWLMMNYSTLYYDTVSITHSLSRESWLILKFIFNLMLSVDAPLYILNSSGPRSRRGNAEIGYHERDVQ